MLCSWGVDAPYHGRAFPAYVAQLQREHDGVVAAMLALEVEGDSTDRQQWSRLDSLQSMLWQQIESVVQQPDPHAGYTSFEDWELVQISAEQNTTPLHDGHIDYAQLKERIDILSFIGAFTELRRAGRSWRGKCPLPDHQDDSPSLHVYPEQRSWWCYGCRRGRDVFDFCQLMGELAMERLRTWQ